MPPFNTASKLSVAAVLFGLGVTLFGNSCGDGNSSDRSDSSERSDAGPPQDAPSERTGGMVRWCTNPIPSSFDECERLDASGG